MLFTILCRKGPQITVTSFIARTSEYFFFVAVGQITLTKKKLNECYQKKVVISFPKVPSTKCPYIYR